MHARRHLITATAAAASVLLATGAASAATVRPGPGARAVLARTVLANTVLASTAPGPGPAAALTAMPPASRVRVSVFTGRDQAGLAAAARAISDQASPRYRHYLSPAQVRAGYGATAVQQAAVSAWLAQSGLVVTHRDSFVISASGTVAQAQSAVRARLELSRPRGGTEQVVPSRAMSVPASLAGSVATIRVTPAVVPMGQHEPLKPAGPPGRRPGSPRRARLSTARSRPASCPAPTAGRSAGRRAATCPPSCGTPTARRRPG